MKIDCSKTIDFIKEKKRMCKNEICLTCPLSKSNNEKNLHCRTFMAEYPEKIVEIMQKWSDEHPQKTYKDDFFEKFPNSEKEGNGYPVVACPCKIYPQLKLTCKDYIYCSDCWDKMMEE